MDGDNDSSVKRKSCKGDESADRDSAAGANDESQISTPSATNSVEKTNKDDDQGRESTRSSSEPPRPRQQFSGEATVTDHPGKGQAHDLTTEAPTLLDVGPGDPEEGEPHVVSESPTGTEINIYETAYREAVERIRKDQGRAATVYLTRRVKGGAEDAVRHGFTATGSDGDRPKVRWGTILEKTQAMAGFKEGASRAAAATSNPASTSETHGT